MTGRKAHPHQHSATSGTKHRQLASMVQTVQGGIFQIRRVAYRIGARCQGLFLVLRSWSVKDFFKRLWTKFSWDGKAAVERLKAGKETSSSESATPRHNKHGLWAFNEKNVSKLPSGSDEDAQESKSHGKRNQSIVSWFESKFNSAAVEKANLLRALEEANKTNDEMRNTHARDLTKIRELREFINRYRSLEQEFHNNMVGFKDETDRLINDYDTKLAALKTVLDQTIQKLKEREASIKTLNASIAVKDSKLSKATVKETTLQEKLVSVESKLQSALTKLASAANEEASSNSARPATAIDIAILHSLYSDALSRSSTLEAQILKLRETVTTLTRSRANGSSPQQDGTQPASPPATVPSAPPTELIVIGVDLGRSAHAHLPSIKAVYRTLVHYISLNHSLALVATVSHGCRGSHQVSVSAWERPHRLALDTLEGAPAGGTSSYERCLASAYNTLRAEPGRFESLPKVVVLLGHAMDSPPAKSLRATCRRFRGEGIQVHSIVVGSVEKAEEEGLSISWIAEQVGGRALSENTYLGALPQILPHEG
ncbi:hypothetical protein F4810DRAFT_655805 [Camillea tinctor]|nr:hypothetical protein F4810DRAFT_655805 [Camillea tinctor]